MKLYKLTDKKHQTRNATQWGENVTHETHGEGELCGPGWLHAYLSSELAVLLNPIHAGVVEPVLWECEGTVGKQDHQLKVGCTRLTTLRIVPLPVVTTEQCVKFAVLCTKAVFVDADFVRWADAWLDGSDRTTEAAARAAARAARAAARAAARVAEAEAARVAEAWTAAEAWTVTRVAAEAAWAARAVACGAAGVAEKKLDLVAVAKKALAPEIVARS